MSAKLGNTEPQNCEETPVEHVVGVLDALRRDGVSRLDPSGAVVVELVSVLGQSRRLSPGTSRCSDLHDSRSCDTIALPSGDLCGRQPLCVQCWFNRVIGRLTHISRSGCVDPAETTAA